MANINDMTPDQLATIITPEFLQESAQKIQKELAVMPFQVFQDQTAKYVTVLPGVRNQITFGELDGDAQLAPYSNQRRDTADYSIKGRTLVVYPGNCAKDFDPFPLLHSIWGESLAVGKALTEHEMARRLLTLFAAKIGKHINDVVFVGGVRNVNGNTTADLFDSFDTIISAEITAGNIAAAKGNYLKIGAITSSNAEATLKELWRAADKMLKGQHVFMYLSPEVYEAYCDDYQARHGALPYNTVYEKKFLEGTNGRCEFAVLDNMSGSNYIKITIKQNLLLGTDIFNQQNRAAIGKYGPWNCTFEYVGIYGEQIRCLNKEYLMIGDMSEDPDPDPEPTPTPTPTKENVTITFANDVENAQMGVEFTSPEATTDPAEGITLAYESSDETVATVNATTGVVTLVAAGTTLITAKFAGNDDYNPAQASYALTVAEAAG